MTLEERKAMFTVETLEFTESNFEVLKHVFCQMYRQGLTEAKVVAHLSKTLAAMPVSDDDVAATIQSIVSPIG